jgi:hypothetical protein
MPAWRRPGRRHEHRVVLTEDRHVAVQAARRRITSLFGATLLLVAAGFLAMGALEAALESRYEAEGRVAEGTVLAKHVRRATENQATEYRVSYRFTAHDGRTFEGSNSISVERWEALVERGPVDVEYLAEDPAQPRSNGPGGWLSVALGCGLGGVLALVGAVATVRDWRQIRFERRLLREGVMAEATVVAIEPTNVRVNREPLWRVRYSYRDAAGRQHSGTSGYMTLDEAEGWQPGDIGGARYDAEAPERSLWTGSLLPTSSAK